jgi:RNA polymerase sigma factor (TIGR02999 family)
MNEAEFSQMLARAQAADDEAWGALMGMVYGDLKRIAHGQMARIVPGQTLCTTVLVHETFEKLAAQGRLPVQERSAFYALCACAMRQIIIDHYRKRSASKRSPDPVAAADHEARRVTPDMDNALIDLGRSLDLLARRDERLLSAFEMRYFAGLSDEEIAARMGTSVRSVQRLIARARSWVSAALDADD